MEDHTESYQYSPQIPSQSLGPAFQESIDSENGIFNPWQSIPRISLGFSRISFDSKMTGDSYCEARSNSITCCGSPVAQRDTS